STDSRGISKSTIRFGEASPWRIHPASMDTPGKVSAQVKARFLRACGHGLHGSKWGAGGVAPCTPGCRVCKACVAGSAPPVGRCLVKGLAPGETARTIMFVIPTAD